MKKINNIFNRKSYESLLKYFNRNKLEYGISLIAKDIYKSYGKREIIKNISLELLNGEIIGILGPNGAGKTTLFYIIAGFIRPNEGKVLFSSLDITHFNMYEKARLGIVYLPQEVSIFRNLTVEENILVALESRKKIKKEEKRERLEELLEDFSIGYIRKQQGSTLSGGERRRVEIARALAVNPYFLLLDEPFAGIDPISILEIKNLIRKLKLKGIGILITDHNVRDALDIIDRAYVIFNGEILAYGEPEKIVKNPNVKKLYLGKDFKL